MAGCCEHGNASWDFINGGEFFLVNEEIWLIKKASAPCSWLVSCIYSQPMYVWQLATLLARPAVVRCGRFDPLISQHGNSALQVARRHLRRRHAVSTRRPS